MWQIQEIAVNTFENLRGKVIYGLPVLLVNPHCCYKPMAIVRHSYFTLLPPLHAPSMPQDILVILSIVMDSYIAPLLRFHVPTTPKTLLNWIGYTQVLILRPVNPHCGYAFPIASHLLLPAPVSLTVNPFLVRLVI